MWKDLECREVFICHIIPPTGMWNQCVKLYWNRKQKNETNQLFKTTKRRNHGHTIQEQFHSTQQLIKEWLRWKQKWNHVGLWKYHFPPSFLIDTDVLTQHGNMFNKSLENFSLCWQTSGMKIHTITGRHSGRWFVSNQTTQLNNLRAAFK